MRFAIMGAGGVGGYFGARLAADGNDVAFIARGAHAAALRENGLRLESPLGDLHLAAPEVHETPAEVGLCDVVLFCVKLWDSAAAAAAIRPLLAHDTAVVSLQNGVEAEDLLAERLGARFVLGGVSYIAAEIATPGVIRHNGSFARLVFGERDGAESWRQEALLSACIGAGVEAQVAPRIDVEIWKKFILLAPFAGVTCAHRVPAGEIAADPDRLALFTRLVGETAAVGRARGVALADDVEAATLEVFRGLPPAMKSSMLTDLERGNRLELDWLTGAVVRLGAAAGVPTPDSATIYEALQPFAMGNEA